jgi:hypothetical protein
MFEDIVWSSARVEAAKAGADLTSSVEQNDDDSFAVEGAKIGSTLRIRLPDRALVTDGAALQVQDDNEQFTTLAVNNQKHIGVNFTSAELTMQLDDFADRVRPSAPPARPRPLRSSCSRASRS